MNDTISVGVVVPAHRQDEWLDQAVLSALSSVAVEVRVVVVLNGVAEVAKREWSADPRVQLLHDPQPLGPTVAMIRGLRELTTEFVARLDADDRMLPERLSAQANYLSAHPTVPLVGTAVHRIDETGRQLGRIRMPYGRDVRKNLLLTNVVPHSSVMFRRSMLESAGGYDADLAQMEDYDVILRLGCLGPISVLAAELTEYRIHTHQISRGARPTGIHIQKIIDDRRRLGRVLRANPIGVAAQNLLWRCVQFTRYYRITKPAHEY